MAVFREVRRVLRDDGMMFVNMGDSYAGSGKSSGNEEMMGGEKQRTSAGSLVAMRTPLGALKPLDLCNVPHRVAQALQADGWTWRDTWHWIKRSPMPESLSGTRWERHRVKVAASARGSGYHVDAFGETPQGERDGRDFANHAGEYQPCPGCARCTYPDQPQRNGWVLRRGSWRYTSAVEYVFLFSKGLGYSAFQEQVKEPSARPGDVQIFGGQKGVNLHPEKGDPSYRNGSEQWGRTVETGATRNPRNWGLISSEPMDVARCGGCGRVYLGPELKRLPKRQVEVPAADEDGEPTVKAVRQCKDCGSWEWSSHYAAFPQALVEPFIRAATSDKGVCATCGAQWVPCVDKGELREDPQRQGRSVRNEGNYDGDSYSEEGGSLGLVRDTTVLDYWPTCSCPAAPPVPAVVLDPFCGTATTMLAARTLGRQSIGIDLSGDYLAISVKRLGDPRKAQMEMTV